MFEYQLYPQPAIVPCSQAILSHIMSFQSLHSTTHIETPSRTQSCPPVKFRPFPEYYLHTISNTMTSLRPEAAEFVPSGYVPPQQQTDDGSAYVYAYNSHCQCGWCLLEEDAQNANGIVHATSSSSPSGCGMTTSSEEFTFTCGYTSNELLSHSSAEPYEYVGFGYDVPTSDTSLSQTALSSAAGAVISTERSWSGTHTSEHRARVSTYMEGPSLEGRLYQMPTASSPYAPTYYSNAAEHTASQQTNMDNPTTFVKTAPHGHGKDNRWRKNKGGRRVNKTEHTVAAKPELINTNPTRDAQGDSEALVPESSDLENNPIPASVEVVVTSAAKSAAFIASNESAIEADHSDVPLPPSPVFSSRPENGQLDVAKIDLLISEHGDNIRTWPRAIRSSLDPLATVTLRIRSSNGIQSISVPKLPLMVVSYRALMRFRERPDTKIIEIPASKVTLWGIRAIAHWLRNTCTKEDVNDILVPDTKASWQLALELRMTAITLEMGRFVEHIEQQFIGSIFGRRLGFAQARLVLNTAISEDDRLLVSYANHMSYMARYTQLSDSELVIFAKQLSHEEWGPLQRAVREDEVKTLLKRALGLLTA